MLLCTALALFLQDPQRAEPRFIDLAADRARQVVVDRQAGQYLGHVSMVTLGDGSLLAAYPKGHGSGPIVLKRSRDGGLTWSERLPTPENWATSRETPTLFRVRDPKDGHMRLLCFSGLYPARMAHSEDEGEHWSELAPLGEWGGIVVMGDCVPVGKDRLMAFFHDDGRFLRANGKAEGTFRLLSTESADGGLTWSAPRELWNGSEIHLCEPGCVRSPDGKKLALLLRENRRKQQSHVMLSEDEGAHWSAPRELDPALSGDRHTARYASDGRLLVTFRDMRAGSATKGDWIAWVGRFEDLERGQPGECRVRLADNLEGSDCGYPGAERLPDGTFVLATYGHWAAKETPYILCVRLALAELEARAGK
jgi:BNR repeat-like domain